MNKAEYKRLSHKIREMCYAMSRQHKELTGQNYTSRAYMHNMLLWFDGLNTDKFGHYHYTYSCIGDHDTGLVWENHGVFKGGKIMSKIIIENTWTVDNKNFADPLIITKSYLVSDYDGKKIPNSVVYSVDEFEGDNLDCFKTLKEARQYAKNY